MSSQEIEQYEKQYNQEIVAIRNVCIEDIFKIVEKYISVHFEKIILLDVNSFMKTYTIVHMFTHKFGIFSSNPNYFSKFFLELQESKNFNKIFRLHHKFLQSKTNGCFDVD